MNDSTTDRPFGKWAARLTQLGYRVVPARGKRVLLKGWTDYEYRPQDSVTYADHNVGILTRDTPTLDVDLTDDSALEAIRGVLAEHHRRLLFRYGAKGFALPFQLGAGAAPFKKITVELRSPDGGRGRIEFLADGQQFIALGTHPDTGQPYRWNGAGDPRTVPRDELAVISERSARALIDRIAKALLGLGWSVDTGAPQAAQAAAGEAISPAQGLPPMPKVEGLPDVLWRALDVLDPTPRETWISVGHHLRAVEQSTGAHWPHEAWVEWSRRSPAYQPGDEDRWANFHPDRSGGEHALKVMAGVPEEFAFDPEPGWAVPPKAKRAVWSVPVVDISGLEGRDVRPPAWVVDGLIPRGVPTLLTAHGGTGKSYLMLQAAACVAAGIDFLGRPVETGRVLVYTCEDPEDVVLWRMKHVLAHYGLRSEQIAGRLELRNGYGYPDNVLFTNTKQVEERLTAEYQRLKAYCTEQRFDLVIADNTSEMFDGDEINRAAVRQFVQGMNAICKTTDGGLVLVGHVDAATQRSVQGRDPANAKGYSGSTAWHNSVRSRLFMYPEGDGIVLDVSKTSYGRKQPSIGLKFNEEEMVFEMTGEVQRKRDVPETEATQKVAEAIEALNKAGVVIPATSSGPGGGGVGLLARHTGLKKLEVNAAIVVLSLRRGLREVDYQKTNRHHGRRWELTGEVPAVREVDEAGEGNPWD